VPIFAVMMLTASRKTTLGEHVISTGLSALGWPAAAAMALTVMAMFASYKGELETLAHASTNALTVLAGG
jgi:hypothetical protein